MIDTVAFDFVNTLAFQSPKREDIIYDFLATKALKTEKREILASLKVADNECHYSCFKIIDDDSRKEFFQEYNRVLLEKLEVDFTKKNCSDLYDYYDKTHKEWILHEGAIETMVLLKEQGISVGIISNFERELETKLADQLGLTKHINFLVVSGCIGFEKPDIKFYEYAIKNNQLTPNNTLYIGDSYVLDYLPGRKVGFNCYLFDKNNLHPDIPNRIYNLREVLKII
jgi:HAD superfamily hydrolase (TIGR01549 family)|tara:strand:+ start:2425 stop:3105 length:681 start_codon:yes stop_codon:yes gene_type:complete